MGYLVAATAVVALALVSAIGWKARRRTRRRPDDDATFRVEDWLTYRYACKRFAERGIRTWDALAAEFKLGPAWEDQR